jgi:hypothetical protein
MEEASQTWTGGAHIGGVFGLGASWPFAKLTASDESLIIDIRFARTYVFDFAKVVSVEPYLFFPFFTSAICIKHTVPIYPDKIVFWVLGNGADLLLDELRSLGYHCFR